MITKVIFVVALIMPNGEYQTKSSVVDACPSIRWSATTTNNASAMERYATGTRPVSS